MQSPYKDVRALARGLDVLAAVNRGIRGASEIAVAVKQTRPTVYRLLETFVRHGYLVRSASDGTYRPTALVRNLSDGFRDEAWITELAVPALAELLQTVQWPSDLATFDGHGMLARESTHRFSPLSFHRPIPGRRLSMLSAIGIAHVAFSSERDRKKILASLRRSAEPHDAWWNRRAEVRAALGQARERGFSESVGMFQEGVMAIAVPVLFKQRPIACINVIVARNAMTPREMGNRFAGALKRAAARIEAGLAAGSVPPPRRSPT